MIFRIRLGPERGLVQRLNHVQGIDSILPRNCLNIAIVACRAKSELLEYRNSLRITALYVTDYHVPADQLVKSKHALRFRKKIEPAPLLPKQWGRSPVINHTISRPD
jgi:hypothetical protein